ncbi:hypothetical protein SNEBB_007037 [Seison nebaliae]|nr:hypothetical protein SNEBB_007037 [Seison nebaliae]
MTSMSERLWPAIYHPADRPYDKLLLNENPLQYFDLGQSFHHYANSSRRPKRSMEEQYKCKGRSCYPATGDLLIGREKNIIASSTCGDDGPESYCTVHSLRESNETCKTCKEGDHAVKNLVSVLTDDTDATMNRDPVSDWWQSGNDVEQVNITIDFQAMFHVTHIIIIFRTFRPAAMFIEKSRDHGKSWEKMRYYADDCHRRYPHIREGTPRYIGEVVCDSRYSNIDPSTRGELIYRALPPNLIHNLPIGQKTGRQKLNDVLTASQIRLRFENLHTLGDNLLQSGRRNSRSKYYYAIYEMVVRGSCTCFGHAAHCRGENVDEPIPGMVYGKCACSHNTTGPNCQQCINGYHKLQWRPASQYSPFICEKCQCNNHTANCHFDEQLFARSRNVDGGHCDNCKDNTEGVHCQSCKNGFFHDPSLSIFHKNSCQKCQCDPRGSIRGRYCAAEEDKENNIEAGKCFCNRFVSGKNCDECMDGYYNLSREHEYSCLQCQCNRLGTVDQICDKNFGRCLCNTNVTGELCDQCKKNFYSLESGCKPCECDVDGSTSAECDSVTGQCICKPFMSGRQCNVPLPGYYCPYADVITHNSLLAKHMGNVKTDEQNFIFESYKSRMSNRGYQLVYGQSELIFNIDNIPKSGFYRLAIRYRINSRKNWENIKIRIIRPNSREPTPCNHVKKNEDKWKINLSNENYYVLMENEVCFITKQSYQVSLEFPEVEDDDSEYHQSTAIIDSLLVLPSERSATLFRTQPQLFETFNELKCMEHFADPLRTTVPQKCLRFVCSLYFTMYEHPLKCNCHPQGSHTMECDPYGGQCHCKDNIGERDCRMCVYGYFNFSPYGCQACNCHASGSLSKQCNPHTGKCSCGRDIEGDKCKKCRKGTWGFPSCRACMCNGHALECSEENGECTNCDGNTKGKHCEFCIDNHFGAPTSGSNCETCMCPGAPESGRYYAFGCQLDLHHRRAICNCLPGYRGDRCQVNFTNSFQLLSFQHFHLKDCDVAHYRDKNICRRCECNNNIDPISESACDSTTGTCLACLYHTAGVQCERCERGYFGSAIERTCTECSCSAAGTVNRDPLNCDHNTGQCECMVNVKGRQCDRCEMGYYGIYSFEGCKACECDPVGSVDENCDSITGQCRCREGYGGDKCNECPEIHYGTAPNCQLCNCHPDGSLHQSCDKNTGECKCREGVAGYRCDRCDRGTTGDLPYCSPCGECFDQWDKKIKILQRNVNELDEKTSSKELPESSPFALKLNALKKDLERVKFWENTVNFSISDATKRFDGLNKTYTALKEEADEYLYEKNGIRKELEKLSEKVDNDITNKFNEEHVDDIKKDVRYISYTNYHKSSEIAMNLRRGIEEKRLKTLEVAKKSHDLSEHYGKDIALKTVDYSQQFDRLEQNIASKSNKTIGTKNELINLSNKICSSNETQYDCETITSNCGSLSCSSSCSLSQCEGGLPSYISRLKSFKNMNEDLLEDLEKKLTEEQQSNIDCRRPLDDIKYKNDVSLNHLNDIDGKIENLLNLTSSIKDKVEKVKEENVQTSRPTIDKISMILTKNFNQPIENVKKMKEKIGEDSAKATVSNTMEDTRYKMYLAKYNNDKGEEYLNKVVNNKEKLNNISETTEEIREEFDEQKEHVSAVLGKVSNDEQSTNIREMILNHQQESASLTRKVEDLKRKVTLLKRDKGIIAKNTVTSQSSMDNTGKVTEQLNNDMEETEENLSKTFGLFGEKRRDVQPIRTKINLLRKNFVRVKENYESWLQKITDYKKNFHENSKHMERNKVNYQNLIDRAKNANEIISSKLLRTECEAK